MEALLSVGDYQDRVAGEIERIDQGDTRPRGWQYYWAVGDAEVYREDRTADDAPCIRCRTERDVGILQYEVDLPLTPETEIAWRWCVDELPSEIREDAVPSHDYLSIAVEFDDGRDITYYWSSTLPAGTGYDCPLPAFKGREYHVVIRSGETGLGEWLDERRNLFRDHEKYMGPPPARIVRIWLIANSVFQRRRGECRYAAIVLQSADERIEVL